MTKSNSSTPIILETSTNSISFGQFVQSDEQDNAILVQDKRYSRETSEKESFRGHSEEIFLKNLSHLTIAPDSYLTGSKMGFLRKKQGLAARCSLSGTTENETTHN